MNEISQYTFRIIVAPLKDRPIITNVLNDGQNVTFLHLIQKLLGWRQ